MPIRMISLKVRVKNEDWVKNWNFYWVKKWNLKYHKNLTANKKIEKKKKKAKSYDKKLNKKKYYIPRESYAAEKYK